MRILAPAGSGRSDLVEVRFLLADKEHTVFFRSRNGVLLSGNCETFLASGILPCMKAGGGELIVDGEASPRFLSGFSTVQDVYASWNPSLHRVEIRDVRPKPRSNSNKHRVGAFFSGGVDSFYTLLKNQDQITDLIFVHGWDIRLSDTALRERASAKIREVASAFAKNLIEIETNLRDLLDPFVDWGVFGHGAALAAVGHLLYPIFHRIFIPASHTYADLFPWGSHPVLDRLWNTEDLEFIHDGCEATRVKKVALVSRDKVAMRTLRVCNIEGRRSYNCSRCEKCLRTMINLKVNNALDRCTSFDEELDLKYVLKMRKTPVFIRENLEALRKDHGDRQLERALERVLNRPSWLEKMGWRLRKVLDVEREK